MWPPLPEHRLIDQQTFHICAAVWCQTTSIQKLAKSKQTQKSHYIKNETFKIKYILG